MLLLLPQLSMTASRDLLYPMEREKLCSLAEMLRRKLPKKKRKISGYLEPLF
jgi:hypothetical protein